MLLFCNKVHITTVRVHQIAPLTHKYSHTNTSCPTDRVTGCKRDESGIGSEEEMAGDGDPWIEPCSLVSQEILAAMLPQGLFIDATPIIPPGCVIRTRALNTFFAVFPNTLVPTSTRVSYIRRSATELRHWISASVPSVPSNTVTRISFELVRHLLIAPGISRGILSALICLCLSWLCVPDNNGTTSSQLIVSSSFTSSRSGRVH